MLPFASVSQILIALCNLGKPRVQQNINKKNKKKKKKEEEKGVQISKLSIPFAIKFFHFRFLSSGYDLITITNRIGLPSWFGKIKSSLLFRV